ncbi:MAG: LemA family protein [bacterium]|nr:LemA family protein [bacterium]
MNKNIIIGIVIVVVLFFGYALVTYNSLVSSREMINNQWAQVETQYQRRVDLIPNLVESVKGVMKQEQTIFLALAEARTRYSGAKSVDEKTVAATQLDRTIGQFLVIVENYPQLKSSENVTTLMVQLEGTENRISVERMRFNSAIKDFNLTIKRFPSSMIASMFSFAERPYFEAVPGSEVAPKVEL